MIGAPYREGGALPDGFDCSGLVTWVFARRGIAVPRDVRRQAAFGIDVPRGDIAPGDLVFFATTGSGPAHVGIATGDGRFIHAPKPGDLVRVESMSASYWASRFVSARRVVRSGRVDPGRNWRITKSASVKCRRAVRWGSGTTWAARGPRGWSASRSR